MKTCAVRASLLLMAMLIGCVSPETLPSPTLQPTPQPMLPSPSGADTPTPPPRPTSTVALTQVEPTVTESTTLPPALQYQPLDILPDLPSEASPTGLLVTRLYLLNLAQGSREELPIQPMQISCSSTSPDGKWLAYCNDEENLLVVQSANGKEVYTLPMGEDWFSYYGSSLWLDNQRLVFNLRWKDETENLSIRPVVVVNPFTGDIQELASDYPDLRPNISGPAGTLHFRFSTVVYHPSLNLVIYPKATQEGAFVVLWDRQAQQALASVRDLGGFLRTPIWSPNGEQFVVAAITRSSQNFDDFIEEWFIVSQEGQVQQLTHFGDSFQHSEIRLASWSPDGQHLAFWLTTRPSQCGEGQNLAVLALATQQVTNYCVSGNVGGDSWPPLWAPDGLQYIIVESYNLTADNVILIMVAIESGWAAKIDENVRPFGWLVSP